MKILNSSNDTVLLIARMLLSSLFFITGVISINHFSGYLNAMMNTNIPFPLLTSILSITINLVASTFLLLGLFTRIVSIFFALYVLASAFLGHPFWSFNGVEMIENEINFMRNISISGGMLLLWITGAGVYSLDSKLKDRIV